MTDNQDNIARARKIKPASGKGAQPSAEAGFESHSRFENAVDN
jgi:hypothetical protein